MSADNGVAALEDTVQRSLARAKSEPSEFSGPSIRRLLRDARELPASAYVIQSVLEEIEKPAVTNQQMEDLLLRDPVVTAGVLRLANSAFFGVPSQIRTLNTAVRIVGRRRLKTLLLHLLVGQLFEVLAARGPRLARVRNQALAAGVVCSEVGLSLSDLEASEFRIGGLLHNVGEFFVAARLPDRHRQYSKWRDSMGPEQAAQAAIGVSFEEAAAIMLEAWRFPNLYVDSARCQLRPAEASDESRRLCAAVFAGRTLSSSWQNAVAPADAVAQLEQGVCDQLGLDTADFERIYSDISPGVEGLKALLRPVARSDSGSVTPAG